MFFHCSTINLSSVTCAFGCICLHGQYCLNDSSEISYHSVTTLADDEIELKIKRDLPVSPLQKEVSLIK